MDRPFEDAILNRIALMQTLEQVPAHMALSFCLQVAGYSQREIADVGGRNQQGIGYHVDVVRKAMERG